MNCWFQWQTCCTPQWMVDSNLQRENILPSEKAKAYKMKLEAIKRQAGRPGKNSAQVGQNVAYRKSGYSKKFLEEHEADIIIHKAAKKAFDEMGVKKLPTVKSLQVEFADLLTAKKEAYAELKKVRDELRDIMKRLLALLLVVLMAVSLCGCAGEKSKVPEPGTALNIFYQAIMDAQPENAEELILFEESNPDLIASFYPGLDSIELSQQAYYMPPIATHPCEIVLVEVKNDADVQNVADIFQARIDMGADNTNYPESAAGWQLYAQAQKSGNFVCMIVLPEGYVIPENVFEV